MVKHNDDEQQQQEPSLVQQQVFEEMVDESDVPTGAHIQESEVSLCYSDTAVLGGHLWGGKALPGF
jgi:hypothetical protein